jgi:hypothetical protein
MLTLLITIVVVLLVVGVLLWGLGQLPLDPTIKTIVRVVVIVIALLWVIARLFPNIIT